MNSQTKENPSGEVTQKLEENLTKQIAKGGGIGLAGRVWGKGVRFLFQIVLARILGANSYGLYALGRNVLMVSKILTSGGLQHGVTRFGAEYEGKEDDRRLKGLLVSVLLISSIAGIAVAVLLFAYSQFIATVVFQKAALTGVLKAFAFSVPFYTLTFLEAYFARVFRKIEHEVAIRDIFHPLILFVIAGLGFLVGYRLMGVVYSFLFSSILSALFGLFLLYRNFPQLLSKLEAKFELLRLATYSSTVLLITSSSLLVTRVDRFMLGVLESSQNVGVYNAAAILSAQAALFVSSFNGIFAPIIADLHNKRYRSQLKKLFETTTRWIFGLTFPVVLIFILFSKPLMSLFGPEFRTGWLVLIILSIAHLVGASTGPVGFLLMMSGQQKIELVNNLVLGGLNVSLNFLLIPRYGILGAGIATAISIALVNTIRLVEVYYSFKMHPYKKCYLKHVFAAGVATLTYLLIKDIATFISWSWLIKIVLFIVIYLSTYSFLGLEREEKVVLQAVKDRLN